MKKISMFSFAVALAFSARLMAQETLEVADTMDPLQIILSLY